MGSERLDRVLTALGAGTRSETREMVKRGRVSVNGAVAKDPGMHVLGDQDEIRLDGTVLAKSRRRVIVLYKPAGILTAARDAKQKTVMDILPPLYLAQSCMPAGRLDKDTTGLLILTNDGELAHRLIAPRHLTWKRYEARVDGPFTQADAEAFAAGIEIDDADGAFTARPAQARVLEAQAGESTVEVRVCEGRYHQVKRMFLARGLHVLSLHRSAVGALTLQGLLPGQYRELTQEEEALLWVQENGAGSSTLQKTL